MHGKARYLLFLAGCLDIVANHPASAAVRNYELVVSNKFLQPDGFNRRCVHHHHPILTRSIPFESTTVANGMLPGPLITANLYDTLAVSNFGPGQVLPVIQ